MKVLMVNKFLYPNGGAETYVFKLGEELTRQGHEVQYFGLWNENNVVGNDFNIYADDYRQHKFVNPLSLVYSKKIGKQMLQLLSLFQPDIVHFNNISYDLTSSIIEACRQMSTPCVMTIHDPQLVCPNHRLYDEKREEICEDCLKNGAFSCVKRKCLHGSLVKSFLGFLEYRKNKKGKYYEYLSAYICPSNFMADKLKAGGYDEKKMVVLRNFSNVQAQKGNIKKQNYALYFGRLSAEKGIKLLLDALPENCRLVVAGGGPLETLVAQDERVEFIGFQSGADLRKWIAEARFTIYPSIWYENSPFSVIESISLGTPVLGTNSSGIAELIEDGVTGILFENKNQADLRDKIKLLFDKDELIDELSKNCLASSLVVDLEAYTKRLLQVYNEAIRIDEEE